MRRRAFLFLALVFSAAACGGSTSPSSAPLGTRFTGRATALCEVALKQKRAEPPFPFASFNPTKPDASTLPAIGRYEARGVQIFRSWDKKMTALGSPPAGKGQWSALLKALGNHTRVIADQQAAAARGDASEFTHDYYAGNDVQKAMTAASRAAGLPICATAAGA